MRVNYPVMLPLVVDEKGELIAYDSWRGQERARIKRAGQRLEIQRVVAGNATGQPIRTGARNLSGWTDLP